MRIIKTLCEIVFASAESFETPGSVILFEWIGSVSLKVIAREGFFHAT